MRYIVAVSGGVDSVVLLHQLVMTGEHELVVAHFDHGIRDDSAADARFVEGLAAQYRLPFVMRREELGAHASEEQARTRRYRFLREVAREHDARIVTAHHQDDLIETIAINFYRGTGWRGLAVFMNLQIDRPLLAATKFDIYDYATQHHLEWVEDSTNSSNVYLRNRLRRQLARQLDASTTQMLCALWRKQCRLRRAIDAEIGRHEQPNGTYSRYFLTQIDSSTAGELLRGLIAARTGRPPTRPQAERALLAIKTARSGAVYQVGNGLQLRFTARSFIVETVVL